MAVTRQMAECEAYLLQLQMRGAVPPDLPTEQFCDNSVSAYSGKDRPEFERMLEVARNGEIEVIVAYHTDRLYRRVPDLYKVAAVVGEQAHLTVQTVQAGRVDFSTPTGRMAAKILATIAEYEIEIKSTRQRSESDQVAASGAPRRGGTRPFGYTLDDHADPKKRRYVVVVDREAEMVRDAVARLLKPNPDSIGALVREWNRLGVRTPRNNKWQHSSFVAVMKNPRNAGLRLHRGSVVGEAAWPAIISRDDFDALLALLTDPARNRSADKSKKHLLSGIVKCGRCGNGLRVASVSARNRKYLTLQCPGSENSCRLAVMKYVAEDVVRRYLANRLTTPDASLLAVHLPERTQLRDHRLRRAELTQDEKLIESNTKISTASRLRQLEAINDEREQIDRAIAAIGRRVALASLLSITSIPTEAGRIDFSKAAAARASAMEHFDALPLDQRRDILRALCEIKVEPAVPGVSYKNGKAYERVHISPRDPVTGEVGEPIRGSELVTFVHSDPEAMTG